MDVKKSNSEIDAVLDIADYGTTIAGVLGVDTTPADIALFAGEAARLALEPQTVSKPVNERAKLIASGASLLLGELGGNKRVISALELIAKGIIDLTIKE